MKIVFRYFFRGLRLVLAPVMIVSEKLSTPKPAVERSAEEQAKIDDACKALSLYQFRTCPFCIKVRKEMARLGLNIELRDTQKNPQHRQALMEGGGRVKVPCLRIDHDDRVEWLYESSDINDWLNKQFGP
ncbi:glutaredoxin family protein [Halomonas halocynthiae]|uniref:glutaredoxin family protein n=1 Tax=Halomonas halocynthiae TaxID=176290 RepID=UPI000404C4CE|nr:glutaredoxin domain-containing protein [Halomonas halocynthiae]